jgi:AcrR family transcriptional regulator
MPGRKTTRRVMKPAARRAQLLEAATTVFARRGYRAASISAIIAEAGVARGTFYLYFRSKEQMFLAILADFHQQIISALLDMDESSIDARDGRSVLAKGFRTWLKFFARHRDTTAIILKEATSIHPAFERELAKLRRTAIDHFAARLRRFQQLGLVRPSLSPELAAHLQMGMFEELLMWRVLDRGPADLDALAAELADFEWNGVRPLGHELGRQDPRKE